MIFGIEYTKNRITNNLRQMAEEAEEEENAGDPSVLPLKFETHDGMEMVYCFNRDTDEFLAQASDMSVLLETLQERFPKKQLIADKEELESMVDLTSTWNTTK